MRLQTPQGLLAVRQAAREVLALAGALPDGWGVRGLRRLADDRVMLDIGPTDGQGLALEWLEPETGDEVRAFAVGDRYAASYRRAPGAWDLEASETPEAIKQLATSACQALANARSEVKVRERGEAGDGGGAGDEVLFEARAIEAWLAAALKRGDELIAGWRLSDVHPSATGEVALQFESAETQYQPRLVLRLRDEGQPSGYRTRSLDLTYSLPFGDSTQADRAQAYCVLAGELSLVLEALDRDVSFVPTQMAAMGESPPSPRKVAKALNLALPADCGFQCTFCSLKDELTNLDSVSRGFIDTLLDDIRRAKGTGTEVLRINGIEPLNAPYLPELMDEARAVGFEEFHVLTTLRPLADRERAERIISRLPKRALIYAPIYGSRAEIHDAVTTVPGSFDQLLEAIANVHDLKGPGHEIVFTTVLMRANVDDALAMRELVRPLGRWWEVHLPFPNTSSVNDKYTTVALRMSDALAAIYRKGWWPLADLKLGEILPCVALQHQQATGHDLISAKRLAGRLREPAGTFYRTADFEHSLGQKRSSFLSASTQACPHRSSCALASACPGKVYTLYAREVGLDELQPVSLEELAALDDGPAILALLEDAAAA